MITLTDEVVKWHLWKIAEDLVREATLKHPSPMFLEYLHGNFDAFRYLVNHIAGNNINYASDSLKWLVKQDDKLDTTKITTFERCPKPFSFKKEQ